MTLSDVPVAHLCLHKRLSDLDLISNTHTSTTSLLASLPATPPHHHTPAHQHNTMINYLTTVRCIVKGCYNFSLPDNCYCSTRESMRCGWCGTLTQADAYLRPRRW
jgi:hypothetical protein